MKMNFKVNLEKIEKKEIPESWKIAIAEIREIYGNEIEIEIEMPLKDYMELNLLAAKSIGNNIDEVITNALDMKISGDWKVQLKLDCSELYFEVGKEEYNEIDWQNVFDEIMQAIDTSFEKMGSRVETASVDISLAFQNLKGRI